MLCISAPHAVVRAVCLAVCHVRVLWKGLTASRNYNDHSIEEISAVFPRRNGEPAVRGAGRSPSSVQEVRDRSAASDFAD